jgi:hypothetical protein
MAKGCTMWPEGTWHECCVYHDEAYDEGGTSKDRLHADQELYNCVVENGHPFIAKIMYIGVRIFGRFHFNYIKEV